jgi:hypothetical protein
MRASALLIAAALLCWPSSTRAENCPQLYNAVKREAMYCGFFCEREALAPLQEAYEQKCIVVRVPFEAISVFENLPDEPRRLVPRDRLSQERSFRSMLVKGQTSLASP